MIPSLKFVRSSPSKRDKQSDVIEWKNPSPVWMYLGLKRNPMPGTLRTDLHGVLHVFHGTVYGYLVLFTYFLGESLERRPGEPVWEVPHCRRFRQLLLSAE